MESELHKCSISYKIYKNKGNLRKHLLTIHNTQSVTCKVVREVLNTYQVCSIVNDVLKEVRYANDVREDYLQINLLIIKLYVNVVQIKKKKIIKK